MPPTGEAIQLTESSLDKVIEQYHQSLDVFVRGNAEVALALFSRRENVTLGNPFGPMACGFERVADTARLAATHMRDGKADGFDRISTYVTPELAYIVEVERLRARLDGAREITPFSYRATTIFLPEKGTWRIIHRHVDPITSPRPWNSVIQKSP